MPPVIVPHPNDVRGPIEETNNALRDAREKQFVEDKAALEADFHADLATIEANKQAALRAAGLNADGGVPESYPRPVWHQKPTQAGGGTTGDMQTVANPAGLVGGETAAFTYQWQRDGVDIGGATANTRVLAGADENHKIRCKVGAVNTYGTTYAYTNEITALP